MNKPAELQMGTSVSTLEYQSGFGNEFATEALAGALPPGQNSPQKVAHGLIAEQLSGTAFTAPRAKNLRTWMYRLRPSAMHPRFVQIDNGLLASAPIGGAAATPNRLRWDARSIPESAVDFLGGLETMAATGDVMTQNGCAAHRYVATASMKGVFYNADGEMLFVPQAGRQRIVTELGTLVVHPGEICVVPRGVRMRIEVLEEPIAGYVCENYGAPLVLPDLGPIGANGLANPRDFLTPVARYEERIEPTELTAKFGGNLWRTTLSHSPMDVVAWHGNYAPYKYDLARFNAVNTVGFDHADPSIFTVLTSPSEIAGTANVDFVIFPPRWMVAEHTFRPPWFHRNVMSEFMGLIKGVYDAKAEGFVPGGASLHNCMSAHGPDSVTFQKASTVELKPHYVADTLAFMFETRYVFKPTAHALASPQLQTDYDACWDGFHGR